VFDIRCWITIRSKNWNKKTV